ncbi:MAG: prepilin-type N-terminal cleavage/methylation domain-containing protein [Planctomycetes bacterium]|nr:prepilin-type N-terminal cleavage/methylation domain-containing protein [Planctomycetota bacterium]
MRKRSAFTIIEILIVSAILLVLAGIVYPLVAELPRNAQTVTMTGVVRLIRQKILYHAAVADVPLSREGYPNTIDPAWFGNGLLPQNVWTKRPLKIQTVHGSKDRMVPNHKTFKPPRSNGVGQHTAWYNAATGAFVALVPKIGSEADMRGMFNLVNGHNSWPEGELTADG